MATTTPQTIPYGDRPMGYVQSNGQLGLPVYASNDFLQFLLRLARSLQGAEPASAEMQETQQAQLNALTLMDAELRRSIGVTDVTVHELSQSLRYQASMAPSQVSLPKEAAIGLTSGEPATVLSAIPNLCREYLALGVVYLTGTLAGLHACSASVTEQADTVAEAPGQLSTLAFSGGAGELEVDLTLPRVVALLPYAAIATHLTVNATFDTGSVGAYGSLIVWPVA